MVAKDGAWPGVGLQQGFITFTLLPVSEKEFGARTGQVI